MLILILGLFTADFQALPLPEGRKSCPIFGKVVKESEVSFLSSRTCLLAEEEELRVNEN